MPIHLHTNRIDEGPHDGITRRNRLAWVLRTGNSMPGKILLVEDNLWNRESIAYFLRQEGYEVTEASNGNGAVQLLDENEFDLVLSDVIMPGCAVDCSPDSGSSHVGIFPRSPTNSQTRGNGFHNEAV